MINKKFIFLAILFVGIITISSVSANDIGGLNENLISEDDSSNSITTLNDFDSLNCESSDDEIIENDIICSDSETIENSLGSSSKLSSDEDYYYDDYEDDDYDDYEDDDSKSNDYIKPMTIHYDESNSISSYSPDHLINYCTDRGNYLKIYKGNTLIAQRCVGYGEDSILLNTLFDAYKYKPSAGVYITRIEDESGHIWANSTITLLKSTTKLSFDNIKVFKGKTFTLVNEDGYNLDSQYSDYSYCTGTIKVTLNGKTYSAKVKSGDFSIKIKAPSKAKTYLCKVSYSGDSLFAPSSTSFKLIVKTPFKTKITINNITTKKNTKYIIKAYVKYIGTGTNINGGYVKFTVNGKSYKVKVSKGVAKLKVKAPSKYKTYKYYAKYLGTKKASKSSTYFKVTVKKPTKKTQKYIYFQLPVKDGKLYSKTKGKYKLTTYRYPSGNQLLKISYYKNGKLQKSFKAIYKIHFSLGYWKTYSRNGNWNIVHDDNVGYVDKVKLKIWI